MSVNFSNFNKIKLETKAAGANLIVVSKRRSIEDIKTLKSLGQSSFGENYLQDAQSKIAHPDLKDLSWHFIGQIQTRKLKTICQLFDWIHSIDNAKHLDKIASFNLAHPLNICIQFTLTERQHRGGTSLEVLDTLLEQAYAIPQIRLRGLMFMAEPNMDTQTQFQMAKEVYQKRQQHFQLDTLSMGMSHDYQQALAHGATLVRIGQLIFG